jgi:hypothetical protein
VKRRRATHFIFTFGIEVAVLYPFLKEEATKSHVAESFGGGIKAVIRLNDAEKPHRHTFLPPSDGSELAEEVERALTC